MTTTPTIWLDLGDGITRIDSDYQRPGLVAFYLLAQGDQVAFIDAGTFNGAANALQTLRAKNFAPEQVAYVIPTHVHLDHAGAAGAMMRKFPNAKLVIHPRGARHMIDPAQLTAAVEQVYGAERAEREFGRPIPVPAERVIQAPDNFTLDLNGRELLFLDTPGHARHHFCVVDAGSGSIFTGDTFGMSYREFDTARGAFILPTTPPAQFEPDALHRSIDRLLEYKPRQILLTHFGQVHDIARLAADMHGMIEAFVALGRKVQHTAADRYQRLVDGQHAIILPRLRAHGCELTDAEIYSLLKHDYDLNAQGISMWLDRAAA